MKGLYKSPLKVYLIMAALACVGVLLGLKLPISLYPNSSKPVIYVSINYGSMNSKEFLEKHGKIIEAKLDSLANSDLNIDSIISDYQKTRVRYEVEFAWQTNPKVAKKEVENVLVGLSATWAREIRDSMNIGFWSRSSGFVAISFYSPSRDIENLYETLDSVITPKLSSVKDAQGANLWNPARKEVRITLRPEALSAYGLFPRHIQEAIEKGMNGAYAGDISVGLKKLSVQMPRYVNNINDLKNLIVKTDSGQSVLLEKLADIKLQEAKDSNNIFKTNGVKSLILFANPKTGANVKKMAEDILAITKQSMKQLPTDIKYKVLVDPSEFIRASVNNVIHEVFLAAALAVFVLYLFVGSFKNTITAALEIPLSMILAFIMMKITGMNINLISLGGLALAAGMNVDASVVTMENIFRHLDRQKSALNFSQRLSIVTKAVREVALPITTSTLSTLVVFAPLAFTSALTYAILGDLAKAVVFSHAFSMFIALILVPTIRLQLMGREVKKVEMPKAPLNKVLSKVETLYTKALEYFIKARLFQVITFIFMISSLVFMSVYVMPTLKKEIIGTPDTDWMVLSVNTTGHTLIQQMDIKASEVENDLLSRFNQDILYTFTQIQAPNRGTIMARLKSKHEMDRVWKAMEKVYKNEPDTYYWVGPWNPAELPIPDPPQMKLKIKLKDNQQRTLGAALLKDELQKLDVFDRLQSTPNVEPSQNIEIKPYNNLWPQLGENGVSFSPWDITDLIRVATNGRYLQDINIDSHSYSLKLDLPKDEISTLADLSSIPINIDGNLVGLSSLVNIKKVAAKAPIYREDGHEVIYIEGRLNKENEHKTPLALSKTKKAIDKFEKTNYADFGLTKNPHINLEKADFEMQNALEQLSLAIVLSVVLIFLTLILQFGSILQTLIVMSAIPLGILGGLSCLWIADSTVSLNSLLGIILLNGIAVNNSIILVEFILSSYKKGINATDAALIAARQRLRPILITSLTTILGMLPIALGLGEGGKILRPLGISVAGGLWLSTILTLFVVPALQVLYLNSSFSNFDNDKLKTNTEDDNNSTDLLTSTSIKPTDTKDYELQ